MTSHTEEEEMNQRRHLLALARAGDPKAVHQLFELYQVRVYSGDRLKSLKMRKSLPVLSPPKPKETSLLAKSDSVKRDKVSKKTPVSKQVSKVAPSRSRSKSTEPGAGTKPNVAPNVQTTAQPKPTTQAKRTNVVPKANKTKQNVQATKRMTLTSIQPQGARVATSRSRSLVKALKGKSSGATAKVRGQSRRQRTS